MNECLHCEKKCVEVCCDACQKSAREFRKALQHENMTECRRCYCTAAYGGALCDACSEDLKGASLCVGNVRWCCRVVCEGLEHNSNCEHDWSYELQRRAAEMNSLEFADGARSESRNGARNSHDAVNAPKHYTGHPSGVECIAITEHMNFTLGNAFKYIWRAGVKDPNSRIEDLRKARWYLEREIKRLEAEGS